VTISGAPSGIQVAIMLIKQRVDAYDPNQGKGAAK
jgi:hypothetical protein